MTDTREAKITIEKALQLKNVLDGANLRGLSAAQRLQVATVHGRLIEVHASAKRVVSQLGREHAKRDDDGEIVMEDGQPVIDDTETWELQLKELQEEMIEIEALPASAWQDWPNELVALLQPVLSA